MRTATNPETGEKLMFDESAGQWVPMQRPSESYGRGLARSALQGITAEFGDELTAGLGAGLATITGAAPSFGEAYTDIRDMERQAQSQFDEANPIAGTAARIGGGLLTGYGGARALAGAPVSARVASMPLNARAGVAAAAGGAGGAIAGAGANEDPESLAGDVMTGGLVGAVLGPLAEYGTSGAQRVMQAGRRAFTPQTAANRRLAKDLADAGLTPEQALAKMRSMGEGATLADVSDATRGQLEYLAQRGGTTGGRVTKELGERSRGQAGEILETFGAGRQLEKLDELQSVRRNVASPLYEQAFERGVEHTDELERVFSGLRAAYPNAWKEARRQGVLQAVADGAEVDPRVFGSATRPSLEGWQAVKEWMDDRASALARAGNNKAAANVTSLKNRLLRELDRQNPTYGEARALWAGTKQFEDMMEEGAKFLRNSSSVTMNKLKNMTPADREAYRVGVAQSLEDAIERMGDTHDVAKLFRKEGMRRKLLALWDNDKDKLREFVDLIDASTEKQKTYMLANPASGSRTARATFRDQDQKVAEILGFAADLATGTPTGAIGNIGRSLIQKVQPTREATRNILGDMLLQSDPSVVQRQLQGLIRPPALPPTTGAGLVAPGLLGAGGGLLAVQ